MRIGIIYMCTVSFVLLIERPWRQYRTIEDNLSEIRMKIQLGIINYNYLNEKVYMNHILDVESISSHLKLTKLYLHHLLFYFSIVFFLEYAKQFIVKTI